MCFGHWTCFISELFTIYLNISHIQNRYNKLCGFVLREAAENPVKMVELCCQKEQVWGIEEEMPEQKKNLLDKKINLKNKKQKTKRQNKVKTRPDKHQI